MFLCFCDLTYNVKDVNNLLKIFNSSYNILFYFQKDDKFTDFSDGVYENNDNEISVKIGI